MESNLKVQKTINVDVEKKNDNLICNDLTSLQLATGTASVVGNYHYYKIKVLNNPKQFIIPIEQVKKRIKVMKKQISNIEIKINIMEQLIK